MFRHLSVSDDILFVGDEYHNWIIDFASLGFEIFQVSFSVTEGIPVNDGENHDMSVYVAGLQDTPKNESNFLFSLSGFHCKVEIHMCVT